MPITSLIHNDNNDVFITFNYTSVLETVYNITPNAIIYIHGSLHSNDDDPILGHGNRNRLEDIKAKRNMAQIERDDKETSICMVIHDYYNTTFKNVNNYMYKLNSLYKYDINEIVVTGHSVAGIDLPYFKRIDELTKRKAKWKIYYYDPAKKEEMQKAIENQLISQKRIEMIKCCKLYDLKKI